MKPSRVLIYYFSGTGNARNVAFWFYHVCITCHINCNLIDIGAIANRKVNAPESGTLVGFIGPTHGFDFPAIMRRFIKRFPKANHNAVFVINTRAGLRIGKVFLPGLSGVLHYVSAIRLKVKGYRVVGLRPVDLPSNWVSIHPAVRQRGVEKMYKRCRPIVEKFAIHILHGNRNYRAMADLVQDTIIAPVTLAYSIVGKYFFAKLFVASRQCNGCGLCEKECPVNAIKMINNRPYWTLRCESCMHCINICPHEAINTAHGLIIGSICVFTMIIMYYGIDSFILYIPEDMQRIFENGVIRFVLASLIGLPLVFLFYRIVHYLMRFRLFERIVILTSLTNYRFWGKKMKPPKNY